MKTRKKDPATKRYTKLAALILISSALALANSAGLNVIRTDFDDTTTQGWSASVTAGSTPAVLSAVPGDSESAGTNGKFVLQMDDSAATGSSTYATLTRAFNSQAGGFVDVTFRIRLMDTNTNPAKGDWRLAFTGNAGTIYLRLKTSGTGAGFSHYDGATSKFIPSTITNISLGAWYEVRISADLTAKKYGWTVRNLSDDSAGQRARVEGVPFYQNGSTVSALSLISIQRGGKFQLDEVRANVFGNNLAVNRSYQFSPAPNYPNCTEAGDATQLTDGIKRTPGFISPSLWTLPECVGWVNATAPMMVTVDLGSIQSISGLSINMCAGTSAGAAWPAHVLAFTSEDGNKWYPIADLVYSGEKADEVLSDGAWKELGTRIQKFSSDVVTRGKFICFSVIPSSSYVFTDEVEVHGGGSAPPLSGTWVTGTAAVASYSLDYRTKGGQLKRVTLDENALADQIAASSLPATEKAGLQTTLQNQANAARSAAVSSGTSAAVQPINTGHAGMFTVQAALWRSLGIGQATIWRSHRYKWLDIFQTPPASSDTSPLSSSMMKDEVRAESLLVSNPTENPVQIAVTVQNIPGLPGWLKVFRSVWTDTYQRVVISSALQEVTPVSGIYTVTIPSGMTTRLWFQVDGHELSDGSFLGNIRIDDGTNVTVVPWNLRVSLMTLARPGMTVFGWDYLNGNGLAGFNKDNREQAYDLMKSHLVNGVWATRIVLPACVAADFNASNQLIRNLDYTLLDKWMTLECPGADRYFVYLNNPGTQGNSPFAGFNMGTAEFKARVAAWIAAITNRMAGHNIPASKLTILVWDEPRLDWHFEITRKWIEGIKQGNPDVQCFIDPRIDSTTSPSLYEDTIALADIVCPYTYTYALAGNTLKQYYRDLPAAGKDLYFYLSSGPAKLSDPSSYYRLHAWHVFREGGSGMGFWSLGDNGGASSSWNEYASTRDTYSPLFMTPTSVTTSIHFEALREGIEDNELFTIVRSVAAAHADADIRQRWTQLETRLKQQTGTFTNTPRWPTGVDPAPIDGIRKDAIELLENANGLSIP